ncbi:nuclease-related domain-containing protein [Vreelandella titanicae]|uniref:nuclease-related domain-containing protein n=1 Tax=Vreelandella titanicae TaxID=664683 RepID=UPI001268C06D|nr:nuclease-related domain-containing protein [Halomonas titanicae]NVE90572.1 NERD domain-containing protein [Halomonas titanicae]
MSDEMRSEQASLWIVPANEGKEIAVLIKAPTPSLKAIISGCKIEILIGLKETILCSGVRIYDAPGSPLLVSGVQRYREEHIALSRLLTEKSSPIFLFNEMDICIGWSSLLIDSKAAKNFESLILDANRLYTGPFDSKASHILDCFCFTFDKTVSYENTSDIPVASMEPEVEEWHSTDNLFIGLKESQSIQLNDKDEGEIFERAIWASLESVFPFTLYKSPIVEIGESQRELTDVLAFHEYGSFLIEAKDLSILDSGFNRTIERRVKGVQKQARKAIKQLVGSSKALKRGERIFDAQGKEIKPERMNPVHCIVLVTELGHSGDWSDVEKDLIKAVKETNNFFHVFDLREFIMILKGSFGRPELVDYNLIERFKVFLSKRSVHIRSQHAPNK